MFRETVPRLYFNNHPLLGVYPPLITRASTPMPPPPGPLPFPPPCPLPVPPPWLLPFPPPGPLPFPPQGLLPFPPTAPLPFPLTAPLHFPSTAPLPFPPPNGQFQVPPPPQHLPTLQRQKLRRILRTVKRTERRSLPNRACIVGKTENSSAPRGGINPSAKHTEHRRSPNRAFAMSQSENHSTQQIVRKADRRSDLCQVKKESSSDDQEVVFVCESEPHQDAENADPKTRNNNKARGKQAAFSLLDPRFRSSAPIYAHLLDARLRSSGPTDLTNGHEDNARLEKPIMPPGLE
uniref:Uncharacterized protein n=1 Tax=Globodera rostochiensis TaxID=31243 RepID=A0A914HKU0_GLORO